MRAMALMLREVADINAASAERDRMRAIELEAKAASLSLPPAEEKVEGRPWLDTQWLNQLQIDDLRVVIPMLRRAHHTDLLVRINGQDKRLQCDWLKHLNIDCLKPVEETPPSSAEGMLDKEALSDRDIIERAKEILHAAPLPPIPAPIQAQEAKPCPFCGEPPIDFVPGNSSSVMCNTEGCVMAGKLVRRADWNSRAASTSSGNVSEAVSESDLQHARNVLDASGVSGNVCGIIDAAIRELIQRRNSRPTPPGTQGEVVKRLRAKAERMPLPETAKLCGEAADLIEQQAASLAEFHRYHKSDPAKLKGQTVETDKSVEEWHGVRPSLSHTAEMTALIIAGDKMAQRIGVLNRTFSDVAEAVDFEVSKDGAWGGTLAEAVSEMNRQREAATARADRMMAVVEAARLYQRRGGHYGPIDEALATLSPPGEKKEMG